MFISKVSEKMGGGGGGGGGERKPFCFKSPQVCSGTKGLLIHFLSLSVHSIVFSKGTVQLWCVRR